MKNLLKITSAIALVAVVMAGCKKYEEGPALSLRSKKARLAGEWKLTSQTVNGNAVTLCGTTNVSIKKDGTLTRSNTGCIVNYSLSGKWELVDNKEKIKVVLDGSGDADGDTSEIVMLKNKMLKFKDVSGSTTTIYTYEQ
jgi:hypothetical protein